MSSLPVSVIGTSAFFEDSQGGWCDNCSKKMSQLRIADAGRDHWRFQFFDTLLVVAGFSPCHDATIHNPQNSSFAITNNKQFRMLSPPELSYLLCSTRLLPLGGVSNARFRESLVTLTASCVHTRISWPTSQVEKDVIRESLMPPLAAMTFIDAIMHLNQAFAFMKNAWQKGHLERAR